MAKTMGISWDTSWEERELELLGHQQFNMDLSRDGARHGCPNFVQFHGMERDDFNRILEYFNNLLGQCDVTGTILWDVYLQRNIYRVLFIVFAKWN